MDFILKKINNALSLSDPGSYDHITYLRSRIEYSLFLCLGLLWKNFDTLKPTIQQEIISDLNKLSIGSVVSAIRNLDTIDPQLLNKRCKKLLDSYPGIRNSKIGHGYEMAESIASELEPLYNEMVEFNPILKENCDIIVVQKLNADKEPMYTGIRYPYNQGGEGCVGHARQNYFRTLMQNCQEHILFIVEITTKFLRSYFTMLQRKLPWFSILYVKNLLEKLNCVLCYHL